MNITILDIQAPDPTMVGDSSLVQVHATVDGVEQDLTVAVSHEALETDGEQAVIDALLEQL